MLRRTCLTHLRVVCLTMLPDGGAMTPALTQLGYTPYSLRSSFQQGHASTHPIEWSKLLDGTVQTLPPMLLADYDSVVGPPGALLYTALLRQSPHYTKVILVEEADKDRWAADYEAYMGRLQQSTKRASQNKIARAFRNMLAKMVVGGDVTSTSAAATASHSSSIKQTSATVSGGGSGSSRPRKAATSSAADVRRAFAAEAAAMQGSTSASPSKKTATEKRRPALDSDAAADEEKETENISGELQHPRAKALQLYEESVKMSIPASQLLVYRHGDGWEPLCSFLEKAVPTTPFPDYDDGLHVLGHLQERIEFAHTLQYLLGGICVVCVLITVLPRCTGVTQFFKDLYTDYQVAFGADSDVPVPVASAAAATNTAAGGGSGAASEADKFEEGWRRRGGSVTRTTGV